MEKIIFGIVTIAALVCFGAGLIRESELTEINCDSIYPAKGYRVTLSSELDTIGTETKNNAEFRLYELTNGVKKLVFADSVYNMQPEMRFEDFNNDRVPDILVQHVSDVRSNYSYNLYMVDLAHDKLTKVKGFEEIKNPRYLPEYDLVDNYVISGEVWTSFYKIQANKVKDYGIIIYDNQTDDGSYDRNYQKALRKITAKKN